MFARSHDKCLVEGALHVYLGISSFPNSSNYRQCPSLLNHCHFATLCVCSKHLFGLDIYGKMSNKPGIPSWQRPQATTSQSPPSLEPESKPESQESEEVNLSSDPEEAIEAEKDESRLDSSALLEQASKFLEDPTIRDAPWDKKVIFLRSKGVRDEELEKLREPQPEISITNMESESERAWPKVRTLKSARRFRCTAAK
jgi:hypothetical protein